MQIFGFLSVAKLIVQIAARYFFAAPPPKFGAFGFLGSNSTHTYIDVEIDAYRDACRDKRPEWGRNKGCFSLNF
jgi:hypothetical protein